MEATVTLGLERFDRMREDIEKLLERQEKVERALKAVFNTTMSELLKRYDHYETNLAIQEFERQRGMRP